MDRYTCFIGIALGLIAVCSAQSTQDCKLDVALAIDMSGSIARDNDAPRQNWRDVQSFLVRLVESFRISPEYVKVGAVTFNNEAVVEFNLNDYTMSSDVTSDLMAIRYPFDDGGKTNTWDAMDRIRDTIFERRNGERDGVQNVVFLITDGEPNMDGASGYNEATFVEKVALLRREDNPRIIGVGVGSKVRQRFMERFTDEYNPVTDFSGLDDIVQEIVDQACRQIIIDTDGCPDHREDMHMFSAVYKHSDMEGRMLLRLDMTIPFEEVLIVQGGSYSSSTSTFRCPCDGLYHFIVSMSDVTGIGVVIMRDDEVVSPMGYVSGNGHISTSTITSCREGQEVYVKLVMNQLTQNYLRCNFNDDMVLGGFSGYIINTMRPQ